ncbi:hypothetical protein CXB51_018863 [Gossypium anomalum]|uniref:Integrase catalytic domain-containing protein n=1 Tax=Gossypium anomalum TaxID=47600 RepID=A0A8J6CX97_9ROSI|nr:hypothetical protein CXB51_018863 [Gossypium anomalum]
MRKQIKYLRTDNGIEFCFDEFNKLCKSEGLTVRHTPQQNGVAERMNRTIIEKVLCMLSNTNLPKSFWAEAASTACFLINRSPSVAIEKKTPQEVWFGNPTDYSDLRIFGCPVYAHFDNRKLEPRSIKCVFLCYKAGVKGYKLWCPENRKVVISRDVVFDETAMLPNLALKDSSDKENEKQVEHQINPESTKESTPQASKKVVRCKWVFKKKEGTSGVEKPRYKVRLFAKGYSQFPGVDFTDMFSPVVKHSSIRALLGIMAMHDLELEQLDKNSDGSFVYLLLYVDDMLIAANDKGEIRKVKAQSAKPVSTPLAAYFRLSSALSPQLHDEIKYMSHVLYSSVVGSLMYAMVCSRPDLSYAVSAFGRTRDGVIGYVDVDFARDLDRRRSLTSYVFTIRGCAISWKVTLQTTVALSTTEAEYMAITEACKEAIWLKGLFSELNEDLQISTVFCDSQSVIFLTKDQMFH